ncbi:MAG TPA: NB-ARC domain-containing protein [Methanothrix sp.]|nr:NB-ARC domain-containing protein [Methanothrix sp.]
MKDFFISYNKADKDWAQWIAWHLEEKGYTTVIQVLDFRPGSNFVLETNRASIETERTIAVLSPNYMNALYTQSEWAVAFAGDPTGEKRKLLPVRVRECEPDGLFGQIVSIDLFGLDEEAAIEGLLAGVNPERRPKQPKKPDFPGPYDHSVPKPEHFPGKMGRLVYVPELPPNFLPRNEEKKGIKGLILSGDKKTTGIPGVSKKVGVQGMGGIGKSVLAAAVAQDDEVRQAFPDGIFWLSIGRDLQKRDLLQIQSKLAKSLGDGSVFESLNEGREKLQELLANKACLLILDDVWISRNAGAFDSLGPNCRMLITTRNLDVITDLGGAEYTLGLLEETKARKLLADWAGQDVDSLPQEADEIVQECGRLPLALAMTGAMLRGKPDRWRNVLHKLQNADLDKIKRDFPHYLYHDLLKAIQVSVDDLDPDYQARYLDFAVFPGDTPIPESVLQTFWAPEGLDEYDSQDAVDLLVARSLIRRSDDGLLSLHDLQFDYVRKQVEDLTELHNSLLEAYRRKCPEGWHTGPNDGYFFQHLSHHLVEAKRKNELRDLLFDPCWMQAKLEYTDLPALISDYDFLSEDSDSCLVRDALQLSAHVISHDKTQLANQLLARLMSQKFRKIQTMLDQIANHKTQPWIRPLAPTLMPPGGYLLKTLEGHSGGVWAVAVTFDSSRAVSASSDRTLKIWDLKTGEILKTLEGHSGWIMAVAVTPDGKQAVSASSDDTLKVWDFDTGEVLKTLEGHSGGVRAVVVTLDGKRAVSASYDRTIKIWDLETGDLLKTLEGHSSQVRAVAVTSNGHRAVSASDDHTLKVWDLETGEVLKTLEGHINWVNAVALTPDDRLAISASYDRTLKIWDLESGKVQKIITGHINRVNAVAVTPDGHRAISASDDRNLKVWDLKRGKVLKTLPGHSNGVNAVAVTPDGRRAVSASDDHTLKIWDLERGKVLKMLEGHSGGVNSVATTPDGRRALSASRDGTLKMWDLERREVLKVLRGHSYAVNAVVATPDGHRAVSASRDGTLRIWDLVSGKVIKVLRGHSYAVNAVAATPDGHRTVSVSVDGTLRVWDLETGDVLKTLEGHSGKGRAVAVTQDNRRAVSASGDRTLKVWDLETGEVQKTLEGHSGGVRAVALTSYGSRAVSASDDRTLKVWDLETGEVQKTLEGHSGGVMAVALTPDDRRAVSASDDRTLKVWDLETGEIVASFTGDGSLLCCTISLDGKTIVAGEVTGKVHFLRLENA